MTAVYERKLEALTVYQSVFSIRPIADLRAAIARPGSNTADLFAGADGFAEVFPEDKYVVVKQLQGAGHVTGMTDDGVNDAPALRQAEVGIAVSTATDVAKGAASVVLTEAGLTNIVALIEQGRTIYQRILTWIVNKISRTQIVSDLLMWSDHLRASKRRRQHGEPHCRTERSIEPAWKSIFARHTERHGNTSWRIRFNNLPPQDATRCDSVNASARRRFRAHLTQFSASVIGVRRDVLLYETR